MDQFAVESKEYTVENGVALPDDWDELSLEERMEFLFGEPQL